MSKSMLEYLANLRQHGSTPLNIGEATIGRTVYAAGSFRNKRGVTEIALMPMYRTDKVTQSSVGIDLGPTPELLPASYQRSHKTVYIDGRQLWYIAGWNNSDGVLWLHSTDVNSSQFADYSWKYIGIVWRESFATALRLASDEVLKRIYGGPLADWEIELLRSV